MDENKPTREPPTADVNRPAAATSGGRARDFILPSDVDINLVREFCIEAVEHLQGSEVALLSLESDPGDREALNTVFRAFHSIKGVAGFLGISCVTEVAHRAETFFDRLRKGALVMRGRYTDLAFEALDMLKLLLCGLSDGVAVGRMLLPQTYDDLLRRLENVDRLEEESMGQEAQGGDGMVGEILVREGKAAAEDVARALAQQAAGDARLLGEILVEQQAASARDVAHALRRQNEEASRDGTVRVSTARLDRLLRLVDELIMAESFARQAPNTSRGASAELAVHLSRLAEITRAVRDTVMTMRVVSLKPTFQRMVRLVRDLARKSRKEIRFETEGEEIELDRLVVEAISDPLLHLVRNAADHGIEPPEERERAGKAREGCILLRAAQEDGTLVISLWDDGRGLDRRKILAKAVECGLAEAGAQLEDKEIGLMIFLPGLSTTDGVTDISGRGVGLDVVRSNVEALGGTVEVFSEEGKGCVFSIHLPLTQPRDG